MVKLIRYSQEFDVVIFLTPRFHHHHSIIEELEQLADSYWVDLLIMFGISQTCMLKK